jgi:hypothetical protein
MIIADDVQSDINIIKTIIEYAGLSNYFNIYECLHVEQGNDNKTLNVLINKLNRVDIAIIDLLWEQEYVGQKFEAGGKRAADIVKGKFPDCKIIFESYDPVEAEDEKILHKYNAIYLKKETTPNALNKGKSRLANTIKECIRVKLIEIASSEATKKQLLSAFNSHGEIVWNTEISINNKKWTFENLFFIYKENVEELKEVIFSIDEIIKRDDNISLKVAYIDLKNEYDHYKKGEKFEDFVCSLFRKIGYKNIQKRVIDKSRNEVDLIVRNEIDDIFLTGFGQFLLIECKNQPDENIGKNDFIQFFSKLENTNDLARLGVIFASGYFAQTTYIEALRTSKTNKKIMFFSNTEIERLIEAKNMREEFKDIIGEQVKDN